MNRAVRITLAVAVGVFVVLAIAARRSEAPRAGSAFGSCMAALHQVDSRATDFEGAPSLAERGCQSADAWFTADGTLKVTLGEFCRANVDEAECERRFPRGPASPSSNAVAAPTQYPTPMIAGAQFYDGSLADQQRRFSACLAFNTRNLRPGLSDDAHIKAVAAAGVFCDDWVRAHGPGPNGY